jgi:polysaccharide biosynthesis protein VpsM
MKNKSRLFLYFLASSLLFWISPTSVTAAPLVSIGDNTDIFFNGSSSLRWSSNIFRNENNEESDTSWIVSPGFEINVGRGISNADLTVVTRYDVVSYKDNDHLDTELFHIEALGSYKTSRLSVNGSASYDETKINTPENNISDDLVELNTTSVDFDAEYRVSPKFSFSAGYKYSETEYQTYQDSFSDRETTRFPLNVYYELTPKLDLILGYTHSVTDIKGLSRLLRPGVTEVYTGYDKDSDFFNVGLRGNILTKLTGYFKIGHRTISAGDSNKLENGTIVKTYDRDNSGMLGLDANLTWMASSKLLVQLALSRDFGTGGLGEAVETDSANLVGNYSFNAHWSAMANLGYTERDASNIGLENELLNGGLRLTYVLNQYWRFSAGYTYSENDSNQAGSDYESDTLDLTAILRY